MKYSNHSSEIFISPIDWNEFQIIREGKEIGEKWHKVWRRNICFDRYEVKEIWYGYKLGVETWVEYFRSKFLRELRRIFISKFWYASPRMLLSIFLYSLFLYSCIRTFKICRYPENIHKIRIKLKYSFSLYDRFSRFLQKSIWFDAIWFKSRVIFQQCPSRFNRLYSNFPRYFFLSWIFTSISRYVFSSSLPFRNLITSYQLLFFFILFLWKNMKPAVCSGDKVVNAESQNSFKFCIQRKSFCLALGSLYREI